jgi:beta-glucanase (GH16 family)
MNLSKKIIAIIIAMLFLNEVSFAAKSGGWKFDWSDEFNGTSIDAAVWGYESGYVRNNEDQYYTDRSENSRIDNGNLLIQALQDNWNGHKYTSASRRTSGKKSWLYGKFEMRAKIDIRQGSWPAWWWLPNSGGWPKGGEIDMMEFYKGNLLFNVMDGNKTWTSKTKGVSSLGGSDWAAQFHVWTWEWDSTKIDISLDGTLMNHYILSKADGTGPSGANPFRKPGYMLVNQAIGGNNGGDPSKTVFPVEYRVDWIRIHTWNAGTSFTLTVTGGTGGGPYITATHASITALPPKKGEVFDKWVINSGNPTIDNPQGASALLTMPSEDVKVTSSYKKSTSVKQPFSPITLKKLEQNGSTTVYTILGRRVVSTDREGHGLLSRLPSGVYIITRTGHCPAVPIMKP